jgi:hypothetical protein
MCVCERERERERERGMGFICSRSVFHFNATAQESPLLLGLSCGSKRDTIAEPFSAALATSRNSSITGGEKEEIKNGESPLVGPNEVDKG